MCLPKSQRKADGGLSNLMMGGRETVEIFPKHKAVMKMRAEDKAPGALRFEHPDSVFTTGPGK